MYTVSDMLIISLLKKNIKITLVSFIISLIYFIAYYFSLGYMIVTDMGELSIEILKNWTEVIFKSRAIFLWEPIGALALGKVVFLISIPNVILGIFMAGLVFLNLFLAIMLYKLPKMCKIDYKPIGILAILPSFLTGFACCVPTFLISFGSVFASFSLYLIRFRWLFIPLSIIFLIIGYVYSLKKVSVFVK